MDSLRVPRGTYMASVDGACGMDISFLDPQPSKISNMGLAGFICKPPMGKKGSSRIES